MHAIEPSCTDTVREKRRLAKERIVSARDTASTFVVLDAEGQSVSYQVSPHASVQLVSGGAVVECYVFVPDRS